MKIVLREKCPNKEFFLVNIFPYLDRIWKKQTKENSVFGHFSHSAVWKLLNNDKNKWAISLLAALLSVSL